MDRELRDTTIARTFEHRAEFEQDDGPDSDDEEAGGAAGGGGGDADDGDGDLLPVDLDLNLVMNMLRSVEGQDGGSGPAGNILGELGVALGSLETK